MFWYEFIAGIVLFVPLVLLLWYVWWWVADWLDEPNIPFGRDRCLYCINPAKGSPEERIAFLGRVGFKSKHLWGNWYWLTRE